MRNEKLTNVLNALRTTKSFKGSIADNWAQKHYMTDKDVEDALRDRMNMLLKVTSIQGCGEMTKHEKKELNLLKFYFSGL